MLCSLILFILFIWVLYKPYNYWSQKMVKQGKPLPIFGDIFKSALRQQSPPEMVQTLYDMFPDSRYSGFYQFFTPTLLIRDPELIKQITVKDFDHFLNHNHFFPPEVDQLFGNTLFALSGQKWKDMRSTLSPAFTSSKIKAMFLFMKKSGEQFVEHFSKTENVLELELREAFSKITNDVIASTAFGVECNSLQNPKNEFLLLGREALDFSSFWTNFKFTVNLFSPELAKFLRFRLLSEKVSLFFINLVKTTIEKREKENIVRPDMIHLLMEAKKHNLQYEELQEKEDAGFATAQESEIGKSKSKLQLTDLEIASQAFLFFFAGFDGVSMIMSFMAHELAINPGVQEKLIQEIDETRAASKDLTYTALTKMKYMDMVVSEVLRKSPAAVFVDRVCNKPYIIKAQESEEDLVIEKNTLIWIPIAGIHKDPKYFPDPEKFDPERFNDLNRNNIHPYTYLPFGLGPRNCIGSRFALLEIKTMFFYILSHFMFVPTEKTQIPLKISKKEFKVAPEAGVWLGLKKRF